MQITANRMTLFPAHLQLAVRTEERNESDSFGYSKLLP